MKFINFDRIDKDIEIVNEDKFYDLHNDSDFTRFVYEVLRQEIIFEWEYPTHKDKPNKITLTFQKVNNFSISERDGELPFSEDTCLSSIYVNNGDAGVTGKNAELEFQSGMVVKIIAESLVFNIE